MADGRGIETSGVTGDGEEDRLEVNKKVVETDRNWEKTLQTFSRRKETING